MFSVLFMIGGCTQTGGSRKMASDLAKQISEYQEQQRDRVTRSNAEYRDRFNQLMDELVTLSDKQLQQGRDGDAQSIVDQLTADDGTSLIGKLRANFSASLKSQRESVASADTAITATRAAFVKAYREASLDLDKVDKLEKDLQILATKETWSDALKNAKGIIKNVVDTHNELQKAAKAQQQAASATPTAKK